MCLSRIDQKLRGTSTTVLTGYKLFCTKKAAFDLTIPGQYYFRYFAHHKKEVVPVNRWLTAESKTIPADIGPNYKSGFHIYPDRIYAKRVTDWSGGLYKLVEVKYRGVLARGYELSTHVVVAKQMYVPYKKKRTNHGLY